MVGREFSENPSLRHSSNSLLILGNRFLASWRTCEILILVDLSKSREGERICGVGRELSWVSGLFGCLVGSVLVLRGGKEDE